MGEKSTSKGLKINQGEKPLVNYKKNKNNMAMKSLPTTSRFFIEILKKSPYMEQQGWVSLINEHQATSVSQ